MVGRLLSFWGPAYFQGRLLLFSGRVSGWCSTTPLLQPELLEPFRIGKMVKQPTHPGCEHGKLSTQKTAEPSGLEVDKLTFLFFHRENTGTLGWYPSCLSSPRSPLKGDKPNKYPRDISCIWA